jgi:protein gp37
MGVSVETAEYRWRIKELRAVKAADRFLSLEPLLASVDTLDLRDIHWVIVGGESGPGAREMKAECVRDIQRQCQRAAVPFFFKQWGCVRKSVNGRTLDRQTFRQMPQAARRLGPEARAG